MLHSHELRDKVTKSLRSAVVACSREAAVIVSILNMGKSHADCSKLYAMSVEESRTEPKANPLLINVSCFQW